MHKGWGIWEIAVSLKNWTWGGCPRLGVRIPRRLGQADFLFVTNCTKKGTIKCSVLSSVPIRCLAKAYLASGLHMLLSWYSGSFQHYCLQDTEIVSSHLACVVCWVSGLKAPQLLRPSAHGVFHPIAEKYFSLPILLPYLLSWSQSCVAPQLSPALQSCCFSAISVEIQVSFH